MFRFAGRFVLRRSHSTTVLGPVSAIKNPNEPNTSVATLSALFKSSAVTCCPSIAATAASDANVDGSCNRGLIHRNKPNNLPIFQNTPIKIKPLDSFIKPDCSAINTTRYFLNYLPSIATVAYIPDFIRLKKP